MSRIGKKSIEFNNNITIKQDGLDLIISGPKGELMIKGHHKINYELEVDKINVVRKGNDKSSRALHGLYRSLVNNAIEGVNQGFQKTLEMKGVGYRAVVKDSIIELNVGFSHPIIIKAPEGIEFNVEKNTIISVKGIDKQLVGEIAAQIRKVRPPEPYKGKGIKYSDEVVKRKAGKTAKSGA